MTGRIRPMTGHREPVTDKRFVYVKFRLHLCPAKQINPYHDRQIQENRAGVCALGQLGK